VTSGTVRVRVAPKPAWLGLLIEAVGIVALGIYVPLAWASMAPWERAFLIWVEASAAIALFYQLSGSELIEFDSQKLSICKQVLGWRRASEYGVGDCREFERREPKSEGDDNGLQCKVGWRTIKFGKYISEDEATAIFTALQTYLPAVAQQLCAIPERNRKHFTSLNLS
jgi:hypothetical protein